MNQVTSAKEKYLSFQRGSAELIRAVTGRGTFSNADRLWKIGEKDATERNTGKPRTKPNSRV